MTRLSVLAKSSLIATLFLIAPSFASPAFAAQTSCRAVNLLTQLKKTDKDEYAQILAESRRIKNGRSVFWKIEKKGLKPSYVLGTMHVNDRRILDLPPGVRKRYLGASVVVLESVVPDVTKSTAIALTHPEIMMMPPGKRLEDFLDQDEKRILEAALEDKGISLFAVDYLQPWMVSSVFPPETCFAPGTKKTASILDQQIWIEAEKRGIPVKGLETFAEQHAALGMMSIEAQVRDLMTTLTDAKEKTASVLETMISIYKSGNQSLLKPFLSRYSPNIGGLGMNSEFETNVIVRRNHIMAERALPYLVAGNAFIAVGALHLQGDEGVVELLRGEGFKLTPQ